jgi:hypothetical protein
MALLIEPHYLGSIEYYALLQHHRKVAFEIHEHYIKQTFRNRMYILTAGGIQLLTIPVSYHNRMPLCEVTIDYRHDWIRDHKGAIQSAYAKSPFFDLIFPELEAIWEMRPDLLTDLAMQTMTLCLKIMGIDITYETTEKYEQTTQNSFEDYRNSISAKESYQKRNILQPVRYFQNFGKDFVSNLSIIDLLMSMGPESFRVIQQSSKMNKEHF